MIDTQWWLVELDQYGNPKLTDGPHERREGVEQALYLFQRFGFTKGKNFAAAKIELIYPIEAKARDSNEEAIETLNEIGLKP